MTTQAVPAESLKGRTFGVIADAHVHPGKTPELPPGVFTAFDGADAILALGDMGEAAGLDALQALAPVLAVRGADDADDPRVGGECRLFHCGRLSIGALFDGTRHGIYRDNDPFTVAEDFAGALARCFGRPLQVLLSAATHQPLTAWSDGVLIVNPGSPTLAEQRTVAILTLTGDQVRVQHVSV